MTNGFNVSPGSLVARTRAADHAARQVAAIDLPSGIDAGRSSDELAATIATVATQTADLGEELTSLGVALAAAAREYAAADDAVARMLAGRCH